MSEFAARKSQIESAMNVSSHAWKKNSTQPLIEQSISIISDSTTAMPSVPVEHNSLAIPVEIDSLKST